MPQSLLDYQPSFGKTRILPLRALLAVVVVSAGLGFIWVLLAMGIAGVHFRDGVFPCFLIAGIFAGIAGGLFTVWTRHRTDGEESFWWTLATYYVGISLFGGVMVLEMVFASFMNWGFAARSLAVSDGSMFILTVLLFGTFPCAIVLLPLCWVCRIVVWRVYRGHSAGLDCRLPDDTR